MIPSLYSGLSQDRFLVIVADRKRPPPDKWGWSFFFRGARQMQCNTTRPGTECLFMGKNGCTFIGGTCFEVVEQCEGCARIITLDTGRFCAVYPHPAMKWRRGLCNFATHVKKEIEKDASGKKINPLKAAKRASKKGR